MEEKNSTGTDIRKGPDLILKLVDIFSIILCGFIILNLAVLLLAKPIGETFFDRLLNIEVRENWDTSLLRLALVLSFVQFAMSIFSLYLNSKRLKRRDDRIRISIIVSIFVSLLICFFLILFLFLL